MKTILATLITSLSLIACGGGEAGTPEDIAEEQTQAAPGVGIQPVNCAASGVCL